MVCFNTLLVAGLTATSVVALPLEKFTKRSGAGKRGLCYNDVNAANAFKGTSADNWAYNWGAASGRIGGIQYAPMLWGKKSFGAWDAAIKSAIDSGSKSALSFNEPDIQAQSNMSPAEAAQLHQDKMNPYAGKVAIGSPAVSNGGGAMGLSWLDSFFDACGGKCKADFLSIHWYDSASNVDYFKKHVGDAIALAKSHGVPGIWLTEFQGKGDDNAQVNFLKQVLPWLDGNPGVLKYSYFLADDMAKGGQLTPVGQAYAA